jgi:CubicO group peptidase (beta-lactamase class C family)
MRRTALLAVAAGFMLVSSACATSPRVDEPTTESTTAPRATAAASTTVTASTMTTTISPDELAVSELEAYVVDHVAAGSFSGVVAVAEDGVLAMQEAAGLANRDLGTPNRFDTRFNLGSMDKMFTAVAIMQLVERGIVSVDDTVGDYLRWYPNPEVADGITVHQLLTHTSGMGDYFDSEQYLDQNDQIDSLDDYLALFVDEPLLFEPGSQFGYSNSGYIVLGLIIEAVSGEDYYQYVQEQVFRPSGMNRTGCLGLDANVPDLAVGYTSLDWEGNDTGDIRENTPMLPQRGGSAGGCYSTAPDLLAFANAIQRNLLLGEEATHTLLEGKVNVVETVEYAYGFFIRSVGGVRKLGHGGGFPGVCGILSIYPDPGVTVATLSNSDQDCIAIDETAGDILTR